VATGTAKARRFVTFDEARSAILARAALAVMPAESIALDDALERTLRMDLVAHEPFPRFDNSAMDGFAVRAADVASATAGAPVTLAVSETLAAGSVATHAVARGEAIRIMTGAPLPAGADAVVAIEQTSADGAGADPAAASVRILAPVAVGENVRPAGEDFPVGETLARAGDVIGPGTIALLAALGHAQVDVALPPRVAILSTGDELVSPGQPVGPGQIRDSNTHMMRALVRAAGCDPGPCWHLADDPAAVATAIARVAEHCDAIVTLGGVSAGDFDPVREAVATLGDDVELWKVGMRPGQPQAFGLAHGKLLFGLPGNPVSSAVVFEMLVRPALWTILGRRVLDRPTVRAVLADPVQSKVGRRDFLRVTLEELAPGQVAELGVPFRARLTGNQSSGALSSVRKAQGLAVVPENTPDLASGSAIQVLLPNDWAARA